MLQTSFEKDYLDGLNKQQMKAVESVNGPTLLLAVPGSGKTTVLIKRLGYMINCKGIKPEEILVVTYTVSAAQDMKKRYISFFGEDENVEKIEFRTINGICAKMLAEFSYRNNKTLFSLADDKTINKILIGLFLKYQKDFPSEQDLQTLRLAITYIKNMMFSNEDVKEYEKKIKLPLYDIYYDYLNTMKKKGLMDYDDQMVYAYTILKAYPNVLEHYQDRYKYICVDEAQDTSKIQHAIVRLLADKYFNVFMVGDEDQCIYRFRGSDPQSLISFADNYKNGKVLLMETNYRSNAEIVSMADDFIQHNILRHKKTMVPFRDKFEKPVFINVNSREEQFSNLFSVLKKAQRETAVLYRNNESALPLVDSLDREGIDFKMKNSDLSFFSHRTLQDIRDIVKLAYDPCDIDAFMRIYHKLNLYITKQLANKLCEYTKKTDKPMLEILIELSKEDKSIEEYTVTKTEDTIRYLKQIRTATARMSLHIILDLMCYGNYMESHHMSNSKIEVLKILAAREKNMLSLFDRLDALQDIMMNKGLSSDSNIILTTIHSSKGLEYEDVYMIDVLDGTFPETIPKKLNKMTSEERNTWEEERRLFYVGITRAKQRLYIYDIWHESIFIEELHKNLKERKNKEKRKNAQKSTNPAPQNTLTYEQFKELFEVDTKIRHTKYGKGRVISIKDDKISVMFDGAIVKNTFSLRAIYSLNVIEILE